MSESTQSEWDKPHNPQKSRRETKLYVIAQVLQLDMLHPVQPLIFQSDYTTTFTGSGIPLLKFNMIVLKLNPSFKPKIILAIQ